MRLLSNKAVVISMLVLLMVSMTACDNTVKKAAGYLYDIADVLGEVQSVTIDALDAQLIDQEVHDSILQATLRANQAGQEATNILIELDDSGITDMDLDTKQAILKYALVISDALDPDNLSAVANIQDENIQNKIKTGLVTARAVLATLNALLAR